MKDISILHSTRPVPIHRARRRYVAPVRSKIGWLPAFERLQNRSLMSGIAPFAVGVVSLPTNPTVQVSGSITYARSQQLYKVTLDTQGLLIAGVHTSGINTILSLQDDRGNTLIQSEGSSPTNPDDRIAQHLPAGSYYLSVSSKTGAASFELSTTFTAALAPGQAISEGQGAYAVTAADINGDGKPDLIVPDYYYNQILIDYGVGDGTCAPPVAIQVGIGPTHVLAASLGGDGHLDLVVTDQFSSDITILKGDGQGNFQTSQVLSTGSGPVNTVAGYFSGDGKLDLAVAEAGANGVEIFHNQGDGTFVSASFIGSILDPTALTVTSLEDDGKSDLIVASGASDSLILLDVSGDDQFTPLSYQIPIGSSVSDVFAANFSSDDRPDLAAVSPDTGMISILSYDGFAFRLRERLKAGKSPQSVVAADFNGDGRVDLAAVNYGSNDVSVFVGDGNDGFGAATTFSTGSGPIGMAAADLDGDGRPDIVTTDFIGLTVSQLMNNGDATFRSPPGQPTSLGPEDVVTADLNGDGIPDLVAPDSLLNQVSVLLGRGDGTFRDPIQVPVGSQPHDVTVGDFTGEHIPDMAVINNISNTVTILQGVGDGTFQTIGTLGTGDGPNFIKSADLDHDGHLDLVVTDYLGNDVDIFYGRGDGTFSKAVAYSVGLAPAGISISDLNGDGRPDIAISDSGSNDVEILLANGPRSYAPPASFAAGAQPFSVRSGDFNGDGHLDLIVGDGLSSPSAVSLLMGVGDGTFLPPVSFGVGGSPYPVEVGDFNGDGHLDVVTGNDITNDLSVLLGRGDGTFAPEIRLPGGTDPYGVAVGDFNRDGHLDFVSANFQSSDLTLYLGRGDGTFHGAKTVPLVSPDLPTITAELEGNGVPQVLVANPGAGTITVFNSQGDGTLQLLTTVLVGGSPSGLVVGDFNGDGRPDLAVTDASSGEVLIFLGLGNGTFQSPIRYQAGKSPRSPVVADLNHDGLLDIAAANTGSNNVSVLFGRGDGTFAPQRRFPVGVEPISLLVGDVNGDGFLDIGTVDRSSDDVTELFGGPGGNFLPVQITLPGITPTALIGGDFNGNGQPDFILADEQAGRLFVELDTATRGLTHVVPIEVGVGRVFLAASDLNHDGVTELILANADTGVVTILGGWSGNTFKTRSTFQVNVKIAELSMADLNKDGLPEILITQAGTGQIQTYLSDGNGKFSTPESTVPLPHPRPIVFPLSPGVSDIVSLNNNGQIITRLGRVGAVADFGASINETAGTGISVRDFALVRTGGIPDVASLDSQRPVIYVQSTVDTGPSGLTLLPLPSLGNYTRIISGDLFGNGRDDLVVISRSSNQILIFRQSLGGQFSQYGDPISVGFGPTDVTLAYLTPGALPDLVVADGSSGEATLIDRDSQGGFFAAAMLPAGLAPAGTVLLPDGLKRTSPDEPVGVTSAVFGTSGLADVVVVDRGTDRISILQGLPDGGLAAPSWALTYSTGLDPIQVVAAPLGRGGPRDLIVLNEGSNDISILINNGHGGFTTMPRVDAGNDPTSIVVDDVTGDGIPDLVVSNAKGDLLILSGNGDGTFQPYQRADGTVNLAVGDVTGNGETGFVLTNTAQDLLTVQTSTSSAGFIQSRADGLLAPGPVAIADMNRDGIPDLIVTNTGGNDVFVYIGLGAGHYASTQRFFTGTAPIGLTVADLTGDGLPDLVVANSGSNDVTILIGQAEADGNWTLVPGPRLVAGDRPVSTTVAEVYGDGTIDIVIVNQDDNTVSVLLGLEGGFFDDKHPRILATGLSPVQAFVGHFSNSITPGLVVLNSLSNDMTYYRNVKSTAETIAGGGLDPVAGVSGDFNGDGYSDLAVANNGDSLVNLFNGGAGGLTLVESVFLGNSAHPTDLVVSSTKGGGLQFFVGASGQDHAISVVFASNSAFLSSGSSPAENGLVNSSNLARSALGVVSLGGFNEAVLEVAGSVAGALGHASAQSGGQSDGGTGALGIAAALFSTLSQSTQPIFAPFSVSLGWLIDNILQLAQGQTAEILPLGKDEMAAVAVLLSSPSMVDPLDQTGINTSPVPTDDDGRILVSSLAGEAGTLPPSRLNRFVADLGTTTVNLACEVGPRPGRATEFGPEWVWHRHSTKETTRTATFEDHAEAGVATLPTEQGQVMAPGDESGPTEPAVDQSRVLGCQDFSTLLRIAASAMLVAFGIIFSNRYALGRLCGFLKRRGKGADERPAPESNGERDRADSIFEGSKSLWMKDLPPWIQAPTGARYHRAPVNRRFDASSFRKRKQGK